MKADLQAAGEEVRHLRARLAADSARLQGCKAKRAPSSTPRRSIDGASLGNSPLAIKSRILARSSASIIRTARSARLEQIDYNALEVLPARMARALSCSARACRNSSESTSRT